MVTGTMMMTMTMTKTIAMTMAIEIAMVMTMSTLIMSFGDSRAAVRHPYDRRWLIT